MPYWVIVFRDIKQGLAINCRRDLIIISQVRSLLLILRFQFAGQITDFKFLYYTKDQGLPDNRIYDFQEDLKGRIWISTQTGVSCFDGKVFKNYIHPLKESDIDIDWVGCHNLTIAMWERMWKGSIRRLFYSCIERILINQSN